LAKVAGCPKASSPLRSSGAIHDGFVGTKVLRAKVAILGCARSVHLQKEAHILTGRNLEFPGRAKRRYRSFLGALWWPMVVGCPEAPTPANDWHQPRCAGEVHEDFLTPNPTSANPCKN